MTNLPTFFFSHARLDRQGRRNLMDKFFEDLEERLAELAAVDLDKMHLGTIDRKILQGANWDRELSQPLSTSCAFVLMLTPYYFDRENCGKELFVFLFRSPLIGIDTNGSLTGVENIVPIQWYRKAFYYTNTEATTEANWRIPRILRLLNHKPADDGRNPRLRSAIEFYSETGMEQCVDNEPHYTELLDAIVLRIRDLVSLPSASGVSFATAKDAFKYDWSNHFAAAGATVAPAPPAAAATIVAPGALSSVVAFYVTRRAFCPSATAVDFADQLIAEPLPGDSVSIDPGLAALLADVRAAGVAEGLTVLHAAADPVLPPSPDALVKSLAALSSKGILTALIIDPDIWPGLRGAGDATVEQILRSPDWTGRALVPAVDARVTELEKLVAARGLRRQVAVLPQPSEERVAKLRGAFVAARGGALRASVKSAPGAERVPLPSGVGRERG